MTWLITTGTLAVAINLIISAGQFYLWTLTGTPLTLWCSGLTMGLAAAGTAFAAVLNHIADRRK